MIASERACWTPERDAELRAVYETRGLNAACAALGLGRSAVKNRAFQLGLVSGPFVERRWTAEADAVLREGYRDATPVELIAKQLGRGVPAVYRRAHLLGLDRGRRFTDEQIAIVRSEYATKGARQLAIELCGSGHPIHVSRIYRLAEKLRVTTPPNHPRWVWDRIRELHAQGLNDRQIARVMRDYFTGRNARERVAAIRHRRLRLPAIGLSQADRVAIGRAGRLKQIATGKDPRTEAQKRLANSYGLPDDTPPAAVAILISLAGGPKTRAALEAESLHPGRLWNALGKSYMGGLMLRGMVTAQRMPRASHTGPRFTYFLTPAAMALLARAGQENTP